MRGKYVIFEGMNGSGKSTLANRVAMTLRDRGTAVASLAFPGRVSAAGVVIRDVFEKKIEVNPKAMMWLFVAEGVDMEPHIEEKLAAGTHVLCDRHTQLSGHVYQSVIHGAEAVHDVTVHAHFRAPDYLYIIDVPPEVSLERRLARRVTDDKGDPYESDRLDKLVIERDTYRNELVEIAECWWEVMPDGEPRHIVVRVLDGTLPIEENVGSILEDLGT